MKSFCKDEWTWFIKWNAVSFTDIQVKELDKRASGQAFEVILSPSAPDAKGDFPLSTPKKKEVSLDEIQKKLDAAEERRKVNTHTTVPVQRFNVWLFNDELHVGHAFSIFSFIPFRTMRQRSWST